jgi:hypothetical protein
MDDQGINRDGGGVGRRPQISLGRLFGTMFWTCIFCGVYSLAYGHSNITPKWWPKDERFACFVLAVMLTLLVVSPCMAIGTLLARPKLGALIGLLIGLLALGSI